MLVLNLEDVLTGAEQRTSDPTSSHYQFRTLSSNELKHYAGDPRNQFDLNMTSRLDSELDDCWGAFESEQLAGYFWLARTSIESENNRSDHPLTGVSMSFPKHAAFVYKAFSLESHRGKGVFPALVAHVSEKLCGEGIQQLISTTECTNDAAKRAFHKCGFMNIGRIWCGRIAGHGFIKGPTSAYQHGIRIGKEAIVVQR